MLVTKQNLPTPCAWLLVSGRVYCIDVLYSRVKPLVGLVGRQQAGTAATVATVVVATGMVYLLPMNEPSISNQRLPTHTTTFTYLLKYLQRSVCSYLPKSCKYHQSAASIA